MPQGVLAAEFSGVSPKVKKKTGTFLKLQFWRASWSSLYRAALAQTRVLQKGLALPMCQNNFLNYTGINKAISR